MKEVFADTAYWIACVDEEDQWAGKARGAEQSLGGARLITTDEVLTEVLAAFSGRGVRLRQVAAGFVRAILKSPHVEAVSQTRRSFLSGLDLYEKRLDKGYSLADCISMNLMRSRRISTALTSDRHFEQEGFEILLK
ncbi:MAG: nucleic acid-binding protein [Bdellovibrionota bacterium]